MQGLKKTTKEKTAPAASTASSREKRQQEYSIDYEAYRHFAFFAGLLLRANAPKPTSAVDLVKWYLTEKAYCVPRDLSRPLVPNVYTTLVHNLILDSCVEVAQDSGEDGHLKLLPNKYFLLWAWKDFALDFDVRMRATPFDAAVQCAGMHARNTMHAALFFGTAFPATPYLITVHYVVTRTNPQHR